MMSFTHSERLSALAAGMLELEDAHTHMHIGTVGLFDASTLVNESGGIDFERVLRFVERALRRNARYQQKLARVPGFGQPVWIDDESFNIRYHVRHTSLPAPGDLRQLKRLAGRIMSQTLDRGKPLWEMWFIEGLEGDRFALIYKVHYCMADRIENTDLVSALLGHDPNYEPRAAGAWIPRPAPRGARLLADEVAKRAMLPLSLLRAGGRLLSDVSRRHGSWLAAGADVAEAVASGLQGLEETPFNAPLGPHRRFDWLRVDLEAAKEVKDRLGGRLNDVVLATLTGAIRNFLARRGVRAETLDLRVIVPVAMRVGAGTNPPGSRAHSVVVRLPLEESEPRARYRRITERTQRAGGSRRSRGAETLAEIADVAEVGPLARFAQLGLWTKSANLLVTSLPGPSEPVYLLGARLLEIYPVTTLGRGQALGIALLSYAGELHWGFNSDWDTLPDLHDLVEATRLEFEALRREAERTPHAVPEPVDDPVSSESEVDAAS